MADLTEIEAAQSIKIIGATTSGLETTPVASTANGEVRSTDISNAGGAQAALTVGSTAVLVNCSGSNLTNRKLLHLYNNSQVTIYWGYTSGVTTSTGTPIFRNQERGWPVGPTTNIYVIAGTAGNDTRVGERA